MVQQLHLSLCYAPDFLCCPHVVVWEKGIPCLSVGRAAVIQLWWPQARPSTQWVTIWLNRGRDTVAPDGSLNKTDGFPHHLLELANETEIGFKLINDKQKAIRSTVVQCPLRLDMLLAEKGAVCNVLHTSPCFYIPDNYRNGKIFIIWRPLSLPLQ